MKNDEQIFFKIEDYLDGKLSQIEATAFEQEIAADPELAETVEMHRFEREGLEYMVGEELRSQIKGWGEKPPGLSVLSPAQAPPVRRWWPWGLGGIGLLLLIFLWVKYGGEKPNTTPNPPKTPPTETGLPTDTIPKQQLHQAPIATDMPDKTPTAPPAQKAYDEKLLALAEASFGTPSALTDNNIRSGTGAAADPLKTWREMLRQPKPDYKKAMAGLSKIKRDEEADALLAYSYFKDKQFDKAAAIYQRLAENEKLTNAQKDEAEWQLLMSLLPDSANRKKVDKLLAKMLNQDNAHEFAPDAKALMLKLPKG